MLILREPERSRVRPQAQSSNDKDYLHVLAEAGLISEDPKPRWVGNRRIKMAYNFFKNSITQRAEVLSLPVHKVALDALARIKQANIVKLEVETHADAYTLFESLNNRGVPLTPIDLIKNNLLGTADQMSIISMEETYDSWRQWLEILGDDYSTQERFFRYFYNAMKDEYGLALPGISIATKSNIIRIYDNLIKNDLVKMVELTTKGVEEFGKLINPNTETALGNALLRLRRAQGLPAHIFLLNLNLNRVKLQISEGELLKITNLLTSFFVRRNLTGTPATYTLPKLFMDLIGEFKTSQNRLEAVLHKLQEVSALDAIFEESLRGPVYADNVDVVRFVLTDIAESKMTRENMQDLWARTNTKGKPIYRWSIEHILPQSENLHESWIEMLALGANENDDAEERKEKARAVHDQYVHKLGNLTITGYNSSLGRRSFIEKRDHKDKNGNNIGYKNNLSLNEDLALRDSWDANAIQERTEKLIAQTISRFPLNYS